MLRLSYIPILLCLFTTSALAAVAPTLPTSAKKLTGAEVTAVYDKKTLTVNNQTIKPHMTGTFTVDFAKSAVSVDFVQGTHKGAARGVARINGDEFCRQFGKDKEDCVSLYADGDTIYEINDKG